MCWGGVSAEQSVPEGEEGWSSSGQPGPITGPSTHRSLVLEDVGRSAIETSPASSGRYRSV